MTNLVFATWHGGVRTELRQAFHRQVAQRQEPVLNVLATRAHPKEIEICIAYGAMLPGRVDFWLDSGAFTAWTCGTEYTPGDYLQFVRQLLPQLKVFKRVFVISLDKIPGRYRQNVTVQDIKDATQQTLDNTNYLLSKGLNVVPIHHQGEPLWVMQEYLKLAEYVGISPANDSLLKKRIAYVKSLYPLFKNAANVIRPAHSFGNTAQPLVTAFPFWSADSQSWRMATTYGIRYKADLLEKTTRTACQTTAKRAKASPVKVLLEAVERKLQLEKDLNKLWDHRGISWMEPKGIDLT